MCLLNKNEMIDKISTIVDLVTFSVAEKFHDK